MFLLKKLTYKHLTYEIQEMFLFFPRYSWFSRFSVYFYSKWADPVKVDTWSYTGDDGVNTLAKTGSRLKRISGKLESLYFTYPGDIKHSVKQTYTGFISIDKRSSHHIHSFHPKRMNIYIYIYIYIYISFPVKVWPFVIPTLKASVSTMLPLL